MRSKYREERTLVRGLRRLPGQDRATFKKNVTRLHRHFAQFNVDVSEICQWLMGLRPSADKHGEETRPFWEFFLSPESIVENSQESQLDSIRLMVFEVAVGWEIGIRRSDESLSEELVNSVRYVSELAHTKTAVKMLERLRTLSRPHRMILLKAAANWIVSKYQRGYENWECRLEEWTKERKLWETSHPELTAEVRELYNGVFKEIEIASKRPRVCSWERLSQSKDNCNYAGERFKCGGKWQGHSVLCSKFKSFIAENSRTNTNVRRFFAENARDYLRIRKTQSHVTKQEALRRLLRKDRRTKWFANAWEKYLQNLDITEDTILTKYGGCLPHCLKFNGKEDCLYNPHTEECRKYRVLVGEFSRSDLELESLYRDWRREYLAAPSKPSFRYPSSRTLAVPKIFGDRFFDVDFTNSILRLRLDDMAEGEYISFGMRPWPKDYDVQPDTTPITSVNIHFVGTRARAGFRFNVPHRQCRISVSQDEIERLRSQVYPRQAQDQDFLDEARKLLLANFPGQANKELKILTVDLGDRGGCVALFNGDVFQKAQLLKAIKIDKLYDSQPEADPKKDSELIKRLGLGKIHIGLHLDGIADGAQKIADKRQATTEPELREHDMRRLTVHIRWMIRDWVRLNASQIIRIAEDNAVDLVVFESLRGFRAPGYDRLDQEKKRRLAFFAYGSIRRKVTEKAVERGMRVVTVPYLYSSQVCAKCGRKQDDSGAFARNKRKRIFRCEYKDCGQKMNSDENAAYVLGGVFWGRITLPTKEPESNT